MCHLILKQEQLGFSFHSTESNFPCKTEANNIRLVLRDAENLPGEKLRIRQCPPVSDFSFEHYATSSSHKNGILLYQKYQRTEYVIPIALVTGLDVIEFFLQFVQ